MKKALFDKLSKTAIVKSYALAQFIAFRENFDERDMDDFFVYPLENGVWVAIKFDDGAKRNYFVSYDDIVTAQIFK